MAWLFKPPSPSKSVHADFSDHPSGMPLLESTSLVKDRFPISAAGSRSRRSPCSKGDAPDSVSTPWSPWRPIYEQIKFLLFAQISVVLVESGPNHQEGSHMDAIKVLPLCKKAESEARFPSPPSIPPPLPWQLTASRRRWRLTSFLHPQSWVFGQPHQAHPPRSSNMYCSVLATPHA